MSKDKFSVGDMVTLKDYCKNRGRLAIITETPKNLKCCKIQYIDELNDLPGPALYKNLTKVTL